MKKLLILASFSTLICSCTKTEDVHKEAPFSLSAADPLSSQSQLVSKPLSEEKEESAAKFRGEEKKNKEESAFTALQGKWIHESDSLAYLDINGSNWHSGFEGEVVTQDNTYKFTLTDNLPQFVDPKEKGEFIKLFNKNDTMYYELMA